MTKREAVWAQQYNYEHDKRNPSPIPLVSSFAPPPPKFTGGFPANAPQIFPLQQSLVTLAFNATKLQPHNLKTWRRLRRIFAMLARERKEVKDALWEFLGLKNDVDDEVRIYAKIWVMQKRFEEQFSYFGEKSPPSNPSNTWLFAVVPCFCRAPNPYLRVAGSCPQVAGRSFDRACFPQVTVSR
jgi:hypothetical protein